jgi:hypothetical protein
MKFEEFKQKYALLNKTHNLPDFDEMNNSFDIGKIRRDSGNLIRDIRRVMIEKISYYNKLLEMMINPSNASPIFLMLLNEITMEDKKVIESVMNKFVEIEINAHKLDVSSTETEEIKLIKKVFEIWNTEKSEVSYLIGILERNLKKTSTPTVVKKNRDYYN